MEADWSVEIGASLPSIDLPWDGFVDPRRTPSVLHSIVETAGHPALREAILRLNSQPSPVFTIKCDLWTLTNAEIDPYEFGSAGKDAHDGFASYIDMMQFDLGKFRSFEFHERWVRELTDHLKSIMLFNARIDFVVRAASNESRPGYGVTLYAAGCGSGASEAYASWEAVLTAAVTATIGVDSPPVSRASSSIG